MKKKHLAILLIFTLIICTLCGCDNASTNNVPDEFEGKWAYVHDTETPILTVKPDGKAEYKGESYSYARDDQFIILTDKNGNETKHRYLVDTDGIYVYEDVVYTYTGEGTPEGLVGVWQADKWSFEFTANGEFKEDSYFPGYYTLNEELGTIKLIYNDHFTDTVLYYSIEGNELHMEYPWLLVKMQ